MKSSLARYLAVVVVLVGIGVSLLFVDRANCQGQECPGNPPTYTPRPVQATYTPRPTRTPHPTCTPRPTYTPLPTYTPTATPCPATYTPGPTEIPPTPYATATEYPTATPYPTATAYPTQTPYPVENVYYVSPSGSDANLGTLSFPWLTIQKASNTLLAGDTVVVSSGVYPERVYVSRSGSVNAPIVYRAEGTVVMRGFTIRADYITVRAFDITDTPNLWDSGVGIFVEGSHCIIEDNYIHYATRGGIVIYVSPGQESLRTNCLVRDNRLYRNAMYGIEIYGRNHIIEGNEISHTIQYHPAWIGAPSWVDADGVHFFGSGHVFRRNYIHDITYSDPENINPHIDCFQSWNDSSYHEAASNIVFEQNICRVLESQAPNENGHAFMLRGTSNLTIRNNILQAYAHVETGGGGNSNLVIVNNTLTSDLSLPLANNPVGMGLENCPNTTVKNNVFYNLPAHIYWITGTSTQGLDIGYNLVYRTDGKPLWDAPYPNDLWNVNPLFVNASANDFHLQPTSPAIDAGYNLGEIVPDDYDGISRPRELRYDIGAYEYTSE